MKWGRLIWDHRFLQIDARSIYSISLVIRLTTEYRYNCFVPTWRDYCMQLLLVTTLILWSEEVSCVDVNIFPEVLLKAVVIVSTVLKHQYYKTFIATTDGWIYHPMNQHYLVCPFGWIFRCKLIKSWGSNWGTLVEPVLSTTDNLRLNLTYSRFLSTYSTT